MKRFAVLFVLVSTMAVASLGGASGASATVLCKNSGSPCLSSYGVGTVIEASLKTGTTWSVTADKTRTCEEATIKGEVTSVSGTPGAPVTGTVTSMKVGKCIGEVAVTKTGTFSIATTANGGKLTLEGFELNLGTGVCFYGGPATTDLAPGAMASISASAALPKVSGSAICPATASWSAQYTVTAPEPLYLLPEPAATVLCKTASNPCSLENVYDHGSAVRLELKKESLFTFAWGSPYNACQKVAIEGEVTTYAGGGVDVGGPIKEFSFTNCTKLVTVNKKGTFTVTYTSGSNGTLTLKGFEINDGVFCTKFTGPASFALTGGATASASIGGSVLGCSAEFTWTGAFTVVKPSPLYVSKF
jgi:hypothetical protein